MNKVLSCINDLTTFMQTEVYASLDDLTKVALVRKKVELCGNYFLEIASNLNRKFKERFEEELQKAKESLTKKNGTKNYEKVIERVGRARQKYPSISKYYVIDYIADNPENPKNMTDIQWHIAVPENVDKQSGIYFLRTNVPTFDEKTTWDYYNLTREIECTNYVKHIVMRSDWKSISDYQGDTKTLLRSTSHNIGYFFRPLSQSRRF